MDESPFDKLFTKSVPHILEKIFFSLDYASFTKYMEVNTAWRELLTSETFKRIGKFMFCEDIEFNLWQALNVGNANEVREVLSSGMVNIECTKMYKITPLFFAVESGFNDVVKLLLEEGAEPNCQTLSYVNGWTPLHLAAAKGNQEVAQLLLDGGANINMEDGLGENIPLHRAGNQSMAKLLLDRGSYLNKQGEYGQTPLNCAAVDGLTDVVKFLLEKGAEPNRADKNGLTPLHNTSYYGNLLHRKDIVQLLIENGADLNMVSNSGHTPLRFALMTGRTEIANLIRENGGTE